MLMFPLLDITSYTDWVQVALQTRELQQIMMLIEKAKVI
jgi:hypothetical protein